MSRFLWLPVAFVGVVVGGCGGGGGGASSQLPLNDVGPFSTRGNVTGTPLTVSSYTVQATAVTGTFSDVNLHDGNPNAVEKTPLYYAVSGIGIFSANPDGSNERLLVPGTATSLTLSYDRSKLFYLDNYVLYSVSVKGGTPTQVQVGVNAYSLSPTNKTMAYSKRHVDGNFYIFVSNFDKTGEIRLGWNPSAYLNLTYANESTLVVGGYGWLKKMNLSGTVYSDISPSTSFANLRASNDGKYLAWVDSANGSEYVKLGNFSAQNWFWATPISLGSLAYTVAFSADNRYLLATTIDAVWRIPLANPSAPTKVFSKLGQSTSFATFSDLISGRNPTDRTLVGTSGAFGRQLSTFIYTLKTSYQNGVGAFVGINALTPASTVVTANDNDLGQPFLNYTVEADQFTSISFTTDANWTVTSGLKPGSTPNGAIVTLDANSGAVASVVTYSVSRGNRPTIVRSGGRQTIVGDLMSTFDRSGHDGGPQSQVEIRYTSSGSRRG